MVNKTGRAKGIDGRNLLTANAATRNKYASDELKSYLDSNPVLTAKDFGAYQNGNQAAAAQNARVSRGRQRYGVY